MGRDAAWRGIVALLACPRKQWHGRSMTRRANGPPNIACFDKRWPIRR